MYTALSTCEQEDFRSPYSDDEAEDGGDPGYGFQIVPAPNGQLPVGGASEEGQGLSPWTGEAQERLVMPPPAEPRAQPPQAQKTKGRHSNLKVAIQFAATEDAVAAAGRRRSSRGAGTRPGRYKAMHNGQQAFPGAVVCGMYINVLSTI